MASIGTFPALVPTFLIEWRLSHTEAGWIIAAYYAGYMILVPVLAGSELSPKYGRRMPFWA